MPTPAQALLLRRSTPAAAPGPGGGLPPPLWFPDVPVGYGVPAGPGDGLPPPLWFPDEADGTGGPPGPEPGNPAADVFAALAEWFAASTEMRSTFPGGLLNDKAPPAAALPYVRVEDVAPNQPTSAEDTSFEALLVVYALSADAAKSKGDALADAFLDDARPALRFVHRRRAWREAAVRQTGESRLERVGRAPGGLAWVWRWGQVFEVLATEDPV